MKPAVFLISLVALCLSGCVVKRTTTDEKGRTDEKYIIKRPVKNFIENVEVE